MPGFFERKLKKFRKTGFFVSQNMEKLEIFKLINV